MSIQKTAYYSLRRGELPEGCKRCVRGEKSVFFITGVCGCKCFYCPISDEKMNHDVIFINEWKTKNEEDILEEIRLCSSTGVGITGGDPLVVWKRTATWISRLKKEFGKGFHIHLYTPLRLVTEEKLSSLHEAGLDEIRFHPSLESDKNWDKLLLGLHYHWDVGVEIPVIPGCFGMTCKLIDFIHMLNTQSKKKISFINLNELEVADNSFSSLREKGYRTKDPLSYGVKGSERMAEKILQYVERKGYALRVHYCTAKLKDKVQMRKRIMKRAMSVATPIDRVTPEGLLVRGVLYLPELRPGVGYRKKLFGLSAEERKGLVATLAEKRKDIIKKMHLKEEQIIIDVDKPRLLVDRKKMRGISEKGLVKAVVEEYPTKDGFEVEVRFL